MAIKLITSYFTKFGAPQLGLVSTIKIYEITQAANTVLVNGAPMLEVGDGIYKYAFTTYDFKKNYIFVVNGGATLGNSDRYQVTANESFAEDTAYMTWEESMLGHTTPGTAGENQQLIVDIVKNILKFHTNRTKIDSNTFKLHVYDTDGVTILHTYDLKDEHGTSTITRIFERRPV